MPDTEQGFARFSDDPVKIEPGSTDRFGATFDPETGALNIALWQESLWEYARDNKRESDCGVIIDFYDETGKKKIGECSLLPPTESNPYSEKYGVYTARLDAGDFPDIDLAKLTCAVRMKGPYDPPRGLRYNPNKTLMLPGSTEFVGIAELRAAKRRNDRRLSVFKPSANPSEHERNALDPCKMDTRENADIIPKSKVQVLDNSKGLPADSPLRPVKPGVKTNRTIMEVHVAGFTKAHPLVPEEDRGTFRGMMHPDVIKFVKDLGVTSIELMPVLQFMDNGATNVWGYDPLSLHAVHDEYGTEEDLRKTIDAYHEAGIEVITDVVFNHTAEGNHLGHTLMAFDPKFYFHVPDAPGYFYDYTGCGNSINVNHPQVSRLCLSSMSHLVNDIGADGLRLDLGGIFGRMQNNVTAWDPNTPMFRAIAYRFGDTYISAEPYDTGENGYHMGGFRNPIYEWNKDAYHKRDGDTESGILAFADGRADASNIATILAGSAPTFDQDWKDNGEDGVRMNFGTVVIDHDTPRLPDMLADDEPHNGDHGGGHAPDKLQKIGRSGPDDSPDIVKARLQRAMYVATIASAAHGDLLVHAGDIVGHSQGGDTNPYCVVNPNVIDWSFLDGQTQGGIHPTPAGEPPIVQVLPPDARRKLVRRWQQAFAIRRQDPTLLRREFPHGDLLNGGKDIDWLNDQGAELVWHQWPSNHCFGMMHAPDENGRRFLWYFNSNAHGHDIKVPSGRWGMVADGERTITTLLGKEFLRVCSGGEAVHLPPKTAAVFYEAQAPEPP
ncbi:MAG: hypothetical protein EOM26_07935 [Alphaproteobacteria bacterium]|nr:hypothetical protein [Alphaproteobacteria bacterium]